MRFLEKLEKIVDKNNSLVCVGLDSNIDEIPKQVRDGRNIDQFLFNKNIIDATFDLVCSYKLNIAFYQAIGLKGLKSLKLTIDYLKKNYQEIPVIVDGKIGDISNTNKEYAQFIFDYLKADAATVNPYLGEEAIGPFLQRVDKGIIILCRTSNPGAKEFQNLPVVVRQAHHDPSRNEDDKFIATTLTKKGVTVSLSKSDKLPLY
ncbi:MAG: orotidine-5'-phosphate decarboxylase, partial [Microgenomates group bacterium]